ncbi:unnamed protein product, partial [Cladocopium goreaui]
MGRSMLEWAALRESLGSKMPELKLTIKSSRSLDDALTQLSQQGESIVALMKSVVQLDGHLDAQKYTIGISACGRAKLWQEAYSLYEDMPKVKVDPNIINLNALLSAYEKANQWHLALHFFEVMAATGLRAPNRVSFNSMTTALSKDDEDDEDDKDDKDDKEDEEDEEEEEEDEAGAALAARTADLCGDAHGIHRAQCDQMPQEAAGLTQVSVPQRLVASRILSGPRCGRALQIVERSVHRVVPWTVMDLADVDAGGSSLLWSWWALILCMCATWSSVRDGTGMVFTGLLDGVPDELTLLDVVLVQQFSIPLLKVDDGTKVLFHSLHTWEDFFKLVDACCGLDGPTHGAHAVGVQTMVAVDSSARMVTFHKVHGGCEYVIGDAGCPQVIAGVWSKCNHAAVMSAGFSCQPFSQLGDRKGGADSCAMFVDWSGVVKENINPELSAIGFFDAMVSVDVLPNVISFNAAIGAAQWPAALRILEDIEEAALQPTMVSYCSVLSTFEKSGKWQLALVLFDSLPKSKLRPTVISFNAVLSACEKANQWQVALILFSQMEEVSVSPDIISFNALISSCKGRQWQRALKMFNAMSEADLQPDIVSFGAAISACEKAREWQKAIRIFHGIRESELQPDLISLNAVISSCEKDGQWEQALWLFNTSTSPDFISYSAAMSALEKGNQWQLALVFFDDMTSVAKLRPDVINFNAAISACEKQGRWQEALSLFSATPWPSLVTWNAVLSSCEKAGQWRQALHLLELMLRSTVQADDITFAAVISSCEKGQYVEAKRTSLKK